MRARASSRHPIALWGVLFVAVAALLLACSPRSAPPQGAPEPAERSVSEDLEPFLTSYFSDWSEGNMSAYSGHFHDEAIIVFVDRGQLRARMPLEPFIEEQSRMQADQETRAVERMTGFRADEDRYAATVTVDWLLERGETRQRGVDRFTLIRDPEGAWKIATLVFYVTDRGTGR